MAEEEAEEEQEEESAPAVVRPAQQPSLLRYLRKAPFLLQRDIVMETWMALHWS